MPAKYKKIHDKIKLNTEYPVFGIQDHDGHSKDVVLSEKWYLKIETGEKIEVDKKDLEFIERF
jgi:hypothetical protein